MGFNGGLIGFNGGLIGFNGGLTNKMVILMGCI
jgi:hypothetical protein